MTMLAPIHDPTAGPVAHNLNLDGREYDLEVYRRVISGADAPRIVVVSYQQNHVARELLRICIRSVKAFTPEEHELWVIDNNSPRENLAWLLDCPDINLALNRTEPLPPEARVSGANDASAASQGAWGSYANAVGLEIAVRLMDQGVRFFMSLHMDALPCRAGWLSFLKSKIAGNVLAAGVRLDRTRTPDGVLHVLGYMVDFREFKKLDLDFFPELPGSDVGDRVTIKLREAGYQVFACPNTVWRPELASRIPSSSPFKELHVDRAFDDEGNLIFLHLGRGVRRSSGLHSKGTSAEEWISAIDKHLDANV
jgi:hypothetical protein